MERFSKGLERLSNLSRTDKGAVTNQSTGSSVLDFFASCGSLRLRDEEEIKMLFLKAFIDDPELALKSLFYCRDIRGGLGERRTFRIIIKEMAEMNPEFIEKNIENIPFFGRWDDLYALFDTSLENEAANFMMGQAFKDLKSDQPSLLGKWLKSENASSDETKRLARKTADHFGMTPKRYRKMLSKLREKIGVVERLMSENRWEEIDFEEVPSKAGMIYRDAFKYHQPERYEKYIEDVKSGDAKMNAKTLFPYEIVKKAFGHSGSMQYEGFDLMWDNLPQYDCTEENSMAIVDVSGSMTLGDNPKPIEVAISLGMYLAEHNEGTFKNKFMTFSSTPELVEIKGDTLIEKVNYMNNTNWGHSTDLEAVFKLILSVGNSNNLPESEMPKKLYIISDMEFDQATNGKINETFTKSMKGLYSMHGYEPPEIVYWNVNAVNDNLPVRKDERGFTLVSGASPHIFKTVVNSKSITPYDIMEEALNTERYDRVNV